jgi:hypothetical protein
MSAMPPPIREAEFVAVDTADEEEIKRRCSGFVRSLHAYLNQLPCLSDVPKARRRWKARIAHDKAFGNLGTDPRHWYTFHHGGRNEAQFNVGLYTTHLRMGMGFEFSLKKGGDPTAVHLAYACFTNVIQADRRRFDRFVADNRLEVEWVSTGELSLQFIAPNDVVNWLVNPPREPMWIFVGRLMMRGEESKVMGDAGALASVMESVFCGFRPIWEQTQVMAHAL